MAKVITDKDTGHLLLFSGLQTENNHFKSKICIYVNLIFLILFSKLIMLKKHDIKVKTV